MQSSNEHQPIEIPLDVENNEARASISIVVPLPRARYKVKIMRPVTEEHEEQKPSRE